MGQGKTIANIITTHVTLTHFCLKQISWKEQAYFANIFLKKRISGEIFEGGMLTRALLTILHQIFFKSMSNTYCRTHNVCVCLYITYIACGSALLQIETLYFFLTVLALSAAATVPNIKIRYVAKTPQFAIFGTRVLCVFYSTIISKGSLACENTFKENS